MSFPLVGEGFDSPYCGHKNLRMEHLFGQIAKESRTGVKTVLIESLLNLVRDDEYSDRDFFFESLFRADLGMEVFDVAMQKLRSGDIKILDVICRFASSFDAHYGETVLQTAFELLNDCSVPSNFKSCLLLGIELLPKNIYLAYFYLNCFKCSGEARFLDLFKSCFDSLGYLQNDLIGELLGKFFTSPNGYVIDLIRYLLCKGNFVRVVDCEWLFYTIGLVRYDQAIFNRVFYLLLTNFTNMTSVEKSYFVNFVYEFLAQNLGNMKTSGSLFFSFILIASGDERGLTLFKNYFPDLNEREKVYFISNFFKFMIDAELFSEENDVLVNGLISFIVDEFSFDLEVFNGLGTREKSEVVLSSLENMHSEVFSLEMALSNATLS